MPKISQELFNKLTKIDRAIYDAQGRELMNPIPYQPEGVRPKSLSLRDQMKRLLKTELSMQMASQEVETLEEANNFDIPDPNEIEMTSVYEMDDEYLSGPYSGIDQSEIVDSTRSDEADISEKDAAGTGEPQIPPEGGKNDNQEPITTT